jgi:hypothetical protein
MSHSDRVKFSLRLVLMSQSDWPKLRETWLICVVELNLSTVLAWYDMG